MEGPTPVSAMIHAATMVTAGVYLVIRVFPIASAGWEHGAGLTPPMLLMAIIGTFTGLFAATIAFTQNDIKRVLAYSTISQLGYMIAAIGIGAYVAAAFHLFTHAFFKALLFLGSGSVIHGMEHGVFRTGEHIDPQDMYNMGGLRKKMPITFWTFLIGGLALSGFPLVTAGFWSKDEILADAFPVSGWSFLPWRAANRSTCARSYATMGRHRAAKRSRNPLTMTFRVFLAFIIAGWIGILENFQSRQTSPWLVP
jgi:NADH-quinone oxidoreductase subunit L